MKRLLIAILAVLLCVSLCEAQQVVVMKKKGAPACGSLGSHEDSTTSYNIGTLTGTWHYGAQEFTPTTAGTIHAVQLKLSDAGDPSANPLTLAICTSDGGSPPAPTTTCTNFDNTVTTTSGTPSWYEFTSAAGYAVSTGTYYFFRLYTAQESDSALYIWSVDGAGSDQTSRSPDGTTWTSAEQTTTSTYRITSCSTWE